MNISYKSPFRQFVKKAHKPLRLAIEDEVDRVCEKPTIGEAKKGDLGCVLVHKFRFNQQEYLMAYRLFGKELPVEFLAIDFYKIGTHENYYD